MLAALGPTIKARYTDWRLRVEMEAALEKAIQRLPAKYRQNGSPLNRIIGRLSSLQSETPLFAPGARF
jgi:hypothetical protein